MSEPSTTSALEPEPAIKAPKKALSKTSDFSDRISPMLVKELRQGLRTNIFTIVFLSLHILLCLILMGASGASNFTQTGPFISKILFFFFTLVTLFIQPLRGMNAVSSELKGETIDVLKISGMTTGRILWGKWAALMSQSSLILVTLLPYLFFRYFFGDMQLFSEIILYSSMLLASGLLTAMTVGFSGVTSVIIRSLVPLLLLIIVFLSLFTLSFRVFDHLIDFLSFQTRDNLLVYTGLVFLTLCGTYYFIEIGASAIRGLSENRATKKRILMLFTFIVTGFTLSQSSIQFATFTLFFMLLIAACDLFTESALFPKSLLAPFQRKGFIGKFLAYFLAPGYATGTLFYLVLVGVVCSFFFSFRNEMPSHMRDESLPIIFLFIATGIFPAFLSRIFRRNHPDHMSSYIMFMLISWGISIASILMIEISSSYLIATLFCWVPSNFIMIDDRETQKMGFSSDARLIFSIALAFLFSIGHLLLCFKKLFPLGGDFLKEK